MVMASQVTLPSSLFSLAHHRPSSPSSPSSIALLAFPVALSGLTLTNTRRLGVVRARTKNSVEEAAVVKDVRSTGNLADQEEEAEEEEEISWVQEKREELVQMTGTAVAAIPGPRVGATPVPWLLAAPLAYLGITFVVAVTRAINKLNSPKEKRRRLVSKNAVLCKSIDKYFPHNRQGLDSAHLKALEGKTGFDSKEVLRKYIRYALNERPYNPDLVADLIHLKKVSQLSDTEVAEILNEVSRRIVKEKGPVVMDTRGFTERGIKRKAAVQALFCKLLYLSELEEFCSTSSRSSLSIKEIFGVTDDDANAIRIETLSESTDLESLEKMVGTDSDADEGKDKDE